MLKANHLEIINGKLTGRVLGEIVTKDVKKAQLKAWALDNDLELKDTVAMGDGANNLPMIQEAGIGIAFCAKPIVEQGCLTVSAKKISIRQLKLLMR